MLNYLTLTQELKNLTLCNPDEITTTQSIKIEEGLFTSVGKTSSKSSTDAIDLSKFVAIPGLLNAHDHLLGSYLPKVGNGPYLNWLPWDQDLKASEVYTERGKLDDLTIYKLGYYRQILSGVTTVCDHIPHIVNESKIEDAYVRIIDQYCLSHEISSYELPWGNPPEEIAKSKKLNIPYITHICEGFDPESKRGIQKLQELNGLTENTVLVHAISCDNKSINQIKKAKSHIVWCPVSNMFMFNETMNIEKALSLKINVSLGTDSPISGGENLLVEMKFAKKIYQKIYQKPLDSQTLFQMVTSNPAKAFKLPKLGKIGTEMMGDLVLIKPSSPSSFKKKPYDSVTQINFEDIFLVVRSGNILYLREEMAELLKIRPKDEILNKFYSKVTLQPKYLKPEKSYRAYLIAKPEKLLKEIDDKISFNKKLDFLSIVRN